jgi:hypothetical protein
VSKGKGKGREGKKRINAAAYTRGNAFVSATGQWAGCAIISNQGRRGNGSGFADSLVCSRPRAETRGLAPVTDLRYNSVPAETHAQPCRKPRLPCLVCSYHGQGYFQGQERHSSGLARGRESEMRGVLRIDLVRRDGTHKYRRPDPA